LQISFYLRTAEEGIFDERTLEIRTSGGRCHRLVEGALQTFFKSKLFFSFLSIYFFVSFLGELS
jgi:hypothetical protein